MRHKLSPEALEFFRNQGRKGGKIGGKRRSENLTPARRSEIAKTAVNAREAKRKTAAALEPDTKLAESPSSNSKLFRDGADQRNHERNVRLQEKRLKKYSKTAY
jgi:hypothetical protein